MAQAQLFHTPNGNPVIVHVRPEVNDAALVNAILGLDEYRLRGLTLEGWALDIGAHIGTVGLALAIDHPNLRVVMVEPVPDNADLIRESIKANGLEERCFVVEAMAGQGQGTATCRYAYTHLEGFADQQFVTQNAYIGGIWRLTDDEKVESKVLEVPIVTSEAITEDKVWAFVKLDCEGCEWQYLEGVDPATHPLMVMEVHDASPGDIARILPGYDIEVLDDYGGSGIARARAK